MPSFRAARPCAPYRVFMDDRLAGVAPTVEALYRLVEHCQKQIDEIIELAEARHQRALAYGHLGERAPTPHLMVVDARGSVRTELAGTWRILRFFACKRVGLRRAVDHGWDGDSRPRGTPIPGTGRPHGRYGRNYYRRPGTQSLRRQAYLLEEEGEPAWRCMRNATNLPTAWEDLPRRSWRERNWKRFRKQQWKT